MPSDSFYITLGIIGLPITITGFAMSANASQPGMSTVASFMILGGITSLIILGGGGAFDLYKRFRGWQLEEREENLSYKEREREVKRQEEDLKRQRRQAKEEERRRAENEKARRKAEEARRAEESARSERTQYKKTSHNKPPKEEVSGFGQEKKEHTEGSWFGTGSGAPEDLKKKKAEEETYTQADQNELEKESQSEKDYKYQISLDKHLLLLWALYKTKEHEFPTRNQLVLTANGGQKGNKDPWYDVIEELLNMDLLKKINEKQYAGKESEWGAKITDVGLLLIKKARFDQVTRFADFKEKYAVYLRR